MPPCLQSTYLTRRHPQGIQQLVPEIADNQVRRWRRCNISLAQYSTTSHPQMETLAPFLYAPLLAQYILNETASAGDTAISLHTWGGGTLDQLRSKVPQSGIEQLVSTHKGGGRVLWTNSDPKSLNLAKFSLSLGWVLWTNSTPKSHPLWQDNFHFRGGGGVLWTPPSTFLKYLSGGTQGISNTKLSKPKIGPASQMLWRLMLYCEAQVYKKEYSGCVHPMRVFENADVQECYTGLISDSYLLNWRKKIASVVSLIFLLVFYLQNHSNTIRVRGICSRRPDFQLPELSSVYFITISLNQMGVCFYLPILLVSYALTAFM